MAAIWSPEELAEAEVIYRRLRSLLPPEARPFLERSGARFSGERDEREARGARFELQMLGRLADDLVRTAELERPVAAGATGCSIDLFLPTLAVGVEFMAPQYVMVPPVQVAPDCSPQFMHQEHWNAYRQSPNFTEDQAERLFRAVNEKCGAKRLSLVAFPTWIVVDLRSTDWMDRVRPSQTVDDYLLELGEAFRTSAGRMGTHDDPNELLGAHNAAIGFVNDFRGAATEHLIVFARTNYERSQAETIAEAFGLACLIG